MESFYSLKSGLNRAGSRRSLAGFTLVELLTVIAVIAILAAILIPVGSTIRKSAKFSVNLSNVRQWTVANTLHIQDHKGYMAWRGPALAGGSSVVSSMTPFSPQIPLLPWWNVLPTYLDRPTLAQLQSMGALPKLGENSIWVSPLAEEVNPANNWAAFTCYAPARSSTLAGFVTNVRTIVNPSRTVMFSETPHFSRALQGGSPYGYINEICSPNSTGPYNRNGSDKDKGGLTGKVAVGFFDGSVKVLTGEQIATHGVSTSAEAGNNPDRIVWRLDP